MRTKFYRDESKVYDFLRFPEKIFDLIDADKLEGFKEYEEEVNYFYSNKIYGKYSIYNCVYVNTHLESIRTIDSFLDRVKKLGGYELSRELLLSILVFDKLEYGLANINDVEREIESKIWDLNSIIDYISNLGIESSLKWELISIAQNPVEVKNRYINLLESIRPYFEEYYRELEEEVVSLGMLMETSLNNDWHLHINKVSDSEIKDEMDLEEEFRLIISIINGKVSYWHTSAILRHLAVGIDVARLGDLS